jgi:hypothetical protein
MTITNLETVFLKVLVVIFRQDPKLARAYIRSLPPAVKFEDPFVVSRRGFEIHSKILGWEKLTHNAVLILSENFVSAILDSMLILSQLLMR